MDQEIILTSATTIIAKTGMLASSPNGAMPVEYDQEIHAPVNVGIDADEKYGRPDPAHID